MTENLQRQARESARALITAYMMLGDVPARDAAVDVVNENMARLSDKGKQEFFDSIVRELASVTHAALAKWAEAIDQDPEQLWQALLAAGF